MSLGSEECSFYEVEPRHGWCAAIRSWAAYTGLVGIVVPEDCRSGATAVRAVVDVRLDEFVRRRLQRRTTDPASGLPPARFQLIVVLFSPFAATTVATADLCRPTNRWGSYVD